MVNSRRTLLAVLYTGCLCAGCLVGSVPNIASAGADTAQTAAKIDSLLAKEMADSAADTGRQSEPIVDDETFLRRVSLDLVGQLPSPEQVTAFALDPSTSKRGQAVERLLADKQFGQNWARYWRDVILYRRSDERALIVSNSLVVYLTEKLNEGARWDQIARDFITAKGDVLEKGNTAIIMAQLADPADTTAEMSRIFLGIQIQCAQCHNHPTDRWKREQFHQMAAFFPRIGIRRGRSTDGPDFTVVSLNQPSGQRAPGVMTPTEVEHYMPDLNDPAAKGTLMQPVFFATGQKLPLGKPDADRRKQLADWMTSRSQHWFGKAFVNRMWSELVGQGFYEPIDDMGPDRKPTAPETLEFLSGKFIDSGYDIKWLMRTITATEAYQRKSRSRHDPNARAVVDNCPQRLRSDQLFNALSAALGIDETGPGNQQDRPRRAYFAGPRGQVNRTFGYDPSVRREEVASSIPQALWMMNAPELNRSINGRRPGTSLGKLLADTKDDEAVAVELYLRCLAREPKDAELSTCLGHVRQSGNRAEAFEDILWALVNSTEFLHRR